MANTSKNPRGGAGLLFFAGLGLEAIVVLVAFRATVADAIRSGQFAAPAPTSDDAALADPVAAPTEDATDSPSLAQVRADIAAAATAAVTVCWGLAEPSDAGALMTLKVGVAPDGSVASAEAGDVSGPLAACIEAEAQTWHLTAPGRPLQIVQSIRFE